MSNPNGVNPAGTSYTLLRDDVMKVAGTPFKRVLVYEIRVDLPIATSGVILFAVAKGFNIGSITTAVSLPFILDASYLLTDGIDNELVGIVEVRAGDDGLVQMAMPDLPAGLGGPSDLFLTYNGGVQGLAGQLIFQVSANGPPDLTGAAIIDANNDGIPDNLSNSILVTPPFTVLDNASFNIDDFYTGYHAGLASTII